MVLGGRRSQQPRTGVHSPKGRGRHRRARHRRLVEMAKTPILAKIGVDGCLGSGSGIPEVMLQGLELSLKKCRIPQSRSRRSARLAAPKRERHTRELRGSTRRRSRGGGGRKPPRMLPSLARCLRRRSWLRRQHLLLNRLWLRSHLLLSSLLLLRRGRL